MVHCKLYYRITVLWSPCSWKKHREKPYSSTSPSLVTSSSMWPTSWQMWWSTCLDSAGCTRRVIWTSPMSILCKKFKEVFHTRWLSFDGALQALLQNYSSLVSLFLEETSGKALALHKPITSYKFLYVAHYLADVMEHLSRLSRMYQKSDLDFTNVNPLQEIQGSVSHAMAEFWWCIARSTTELQFSGLPVPGRNIGKSLSPPQSHHQLQVPLCGPLLGGCDGAPV